MYVPGMEILIAKGAIALKGLLAAKGAALAHGGHFVAQQAGQEGLKYLVTALFGSSHAPLLTALAGAAKTGSAVLVVGGSTYTVAEVVAYIAAEMKGQGYSKKEIKKYFRKNYGIEW